MLNEISREGALDIINTHFTQLSQIANTLLAETTKCHYMERNGEWSHFQQEEELPQGCRFSPVLASLVLNVIIQELDKQLRARAAQRKQTKNLVDDKEGVITNLLAFVDDLNAIVLIADSLFYFKTFTQLVNNLGLRTSVILTSTNNISLKPFLTPASKKILDKHINTFTAGKETTDGIVILGFPIGSRNFINIHLENLSKNIRKTLHSLRTNLDNIQTVGQLFNNSILPKFYHTLCADVFTEGINSPDIFNFNSQHTKKFKDMTLQIIKHISATDVTPEHVLELVSRPTSQNGLHVLNPVKSSISAACGPLIRSINLAKYGISVHKTKITLPTSIQKLYRNWNKSNMLPFRTLKKHTPHMMTITNQEYNSPISSQQVASFIDKTPSHLIHEKIMHEYYNANEEHVFRIAPPHTKKHILSILKSIIPTTLLRPSRQIAENRLNNYNFILSFRRSHILPLFHETSKIKCTCNQLIDIYGDHFFSCRKHSKKKMHNHIRNTIHFITSMLGPHANFIPTKEEYNMEEEDLLPI